MGKIMTYLDYVDYSILNNEQPMIELKKPAGYKAQVLEIEADGGSVKWGKKPQDKDYITKVLDMDEMNRLGLFAIHGADSRLDNDGYLVLDGRGEEVGYFFYEYTDARNFYVSLSNVQEIEVSEIMAEIAAQVFRMEDDIPEGEDETVTFCNCCHQFDECQCEP